MHAEDRAISVAARPAVRDEPNDIPTRSAPLRWMLLASGVGLSLVGALGLLLPVLPTTPFLLLASACFVRSSPRLHRRLLANRAFGPTLAQWQRERTVPREAKRKAYVLVVVGFALSLWAVEAPWLRALLAALGIGVLAFLARLPTSRTRVGRATPERR